MPKKNHLAGSSKDNDRNWIMSILVYIQLLIKIVHDLFIGTLRIPQSSISIEFINGR
jgi:hypothetical protein